jgi:hypothetical protein
MTYKNMKKQNNILTDLLKISQTNINIYLLILWQLALKAVKNRNVFKNTDKKHQKNLTIQPKEQV